MSDYQRLFDVRATEAAAADIWSPTPIGSRMAWFLGDTLLGRQKPPGTLQTGYRTVHNAVQVQSGACLESRMAGSEGKRTDWYPQPNAQDYYWPAGVFADSTNLNLVLLLVRPVDQPGEGFDFYIAGVRIAPLGSDLRAKSMVRPVPLPDTTSPDELNIPYGNVAARDSQYVYLYGSARTSQYEVSNYVVRAAPDSVVSGPWEYWTGLDWSPDVDEATPMQFVGNAPMSQLRVTRYGKGWVGIAKMVDGYTDDVTAWYSLSPSGPWQRVPTPNADGRIGTTPRARDSDLVYGASLVNLPSVGWTLMWNVNTFPLSDVAANIWRYGPKFATPKDLPPPSVLFP